MTALGLYVPGTSALHRLPAGAKLLALLAAGAGSVLVHRPWQVGAAAMLLVGLSLLAGLPPRLVGAQLRPLVWVGGLTFLVQLLVSGWERAVVVVGVLGLLVLAAALVTLTTRTTDLVDAVVAGCRPLRVLHVDPERIGLVIALGIRSVPVVVALAEQVRDAQRARGLGASPRAFAVPLVVRALRHADALGEALAARGADD